MVTTVAHVQEAIGLWRRKHEVDRYSPDSSESVLDDNDSGEEYQYSDDSSASSEDNGEDDKEDIE